MWSKPIVRLDSSVNVQHFTGPVRAKFYKLVFQTPRLWILKLLKDSLRMWSQVTIPPHQVTISQCRNDSADSSWRLAKRRTIQNIKNQKWPFNRTHKHSATWKANYLAETVSWQKARVDTALATLACPAGNHLLSPYGLRRLEEQRTTALGVTVGTGAMKRSRLFNARLNRNKRKMLRYEGCRV